MSLGAITTFLVALAGIVKIIHITVRAIRRDRAAHAVKPMCPKPRKPPLDDDAWTR